MERPSRFSSEMIDDMRDRYEHRDSLTMIALAYGCHRHTVRDHLKAIGVPIRSRMDDIVKYHPNHSAFNAIDTEEAAYWLGFIASDGCVMKNTITIALSAKDKEHLEKFAKWFSPDSSIRVYKTKQGYVQARFCATSAEAVDALAKYGIVPRKTWSFSHIPEIDTHLVRHFLRGYLDGDGWIYKGTGNVYRTGFCAISHTLLSEIQNWLHTALNLQKTPTIDFNGQVWTYRNTGRRAATILHYLYNEVTIYLDRKYALALEAIASRKAVCQMLGVTIDEYNALDSHDLTNLYKRKKREQTCTSH